MKTARSILAMLLVILGPIALCGGSEASEKDDLELFVEKNLLVESATRSPKPLSQVAENVTVITAADIRASNAHTLAEVLQRVLGIFVDYLGQDFGSLAQVQIQGSKDTHVLFLVDEAPVNFLSGGNAESNWIPLDVIDRIEVIKGPASSTWGSALGGVINIITVKPKKSTANEGSAQALVGEHNTFDGRAQIVGADGYFLYAGYQHSDGLLNQRDFKNQSFFGKISRTPQIGVALSASFGAAKPEVDSGDLKLAGILSRSDQTVLFGNLSADVSLSESVKAFATLYGSNHLFKQQNDEDGQYGPNGALFRDIEFDESQLGAGARMVWKQDGHTFVAGADFNYGELEQTGDNGEYLTGVGAPPRSKSTPTTQRMGLYLNDTLNLGNLTIVPGVRFDDASDTSSFVSPSIGASYRAWRSTLFRFSAARGFTRPGLSDTSGGGLFMDPNPDLKPETVWSYQMGMESNALEVVWLKATVFRHDLSDAIIYVTSSENENNITPTNHGSIRRQGAELELETAPFGGFSLHGGGCYVRIDPSGNDRNSAIYTIDAGLRYRGNLTQAGLILHRVGWDKPDDDFKGKYNDTIWDLNVSRTVEVLGFGGVSVFGAIHNILDGDQYSTATYPNPGRWIEIGGRVWY